MTFKKGEIPWNKKDIDIELIKKLYFENKWDFKKIAELFGFKSNASISIIFKKYKLKARTNTGLKKGFKHSKETKDKMSQSSLGKKHSKNTKKKISENNARHWKGKKHSIETKIKMSEAQKGRSISITTRMKLSKVNMGKKLSYNTRNKMSIAASNRSVETRKRMSDNGSKYWKDKKLPKTMKQKMRISAIKRVEKQLNNGLPLTPCIGTHETKILNNLEKIFDYKIHRQHRVSGYFLDGYCSNLNLAIEIDEPIHDNNKEKDMIRESNIKEELHCKFLRIKTI